MKRRLALIAVVVLVVVSPSAVRAATRNDAASRAASWLAGRQSSDGSFGAKRADLVADALAAIVAGGVEGKPVDRALGYLAAHGEDDAIDGAAAGRIVAGIVAAGGDPRDHGGTDFVDVLDDTYDPSTGRFDTDLDQLFSNLLAANGYIAAHGDLPSKAVSAITTSACPTGGFGYDYDCRRGADTDTTSWAINVLAASGEAGSSAARKARDRLLATQRSDGGWAFSSSTSLPTSSDSTGLALAAIDALGEDAQAAPWRQADGDHPVKALRSLQDGSGGFRPTTSSSKASTTSTTNVIPGLAGFHYPLTGGPTPATPKPEPKPSAPVTSGPHGEPGDDGGEDDDGDPPATPRRRATDRPRPHTPSSSLPGRRATPTDVSPPATDAGSATDTAVAAGTDGPPAAAGFSAPETSADGPSPLPWVAGGIAVAGAGGGAGLWWLRRPR